MSNIFPGAMFLKLLQKISFWDLSSHWRDHLQHRSRFFSRPFWSSFSRSFFQVPISPFHLYSYEPRPLPLCQLSPKMWTFWPVLPFLHLSLYSLLSSHQERFADLNLLSYRNFRFSASAHSLSYCSSSANPFYFCLCLVRMSTKLNYLYVYLYLLNSLVSRESFVHGRSVHYVF